MVILSNVHLPYHLTDFNESLTACLPNNNRKSTVCYSLLVAKDSIGSRQADAIWSHVKLVLVRLSDLWLESKKNSQESATACCCTAESMPQSGTCTSESWGHMAHWDSCRWATWRKLAKRGWTKAVTVQCWTQSPNIDKRILSSFRSYCLSPKFIAMPQHGQWSQWLTLAARTSSILADNLGKSKQRAQQHSWKKIFIDQEWTKTPKKRQWLVNVKRSIQTTKKQVRRSRARTAGWSKSRKSGADAWTLFLMVHANSTQTIW